MGIARYVRSADDPYAADLAVTIVDDWQGRGLGTELLARLSDRALDEGIHRFTALVAAENEVVGLLLRKMRASLVSRESSTLQYEIALVPGAEPDGDRSAALHRPRPECRGEGRDRVPGHARGADARPRLDRLPPGAG